MATTLTDVPTGLAQKLVLPMTGYGEDFTSSAVDLVDGDGPGFGLLISGDLEPGTTASVHLEESANGSTGWTDIPNAAFPTVAAANEVRLVRFTRTARYVRAVLTMTGETPVFTLGVLIGQQAKTT